MKEFTPILIAFAVSVIGGLALHKITGFWSGFAIFLILQVIIGSTLNVYLKTKTALQMEKELTQRISDAAKQTLTLTCPCTDAVTQTIPIRLDETNFYNCFKCDKKVCVKINASTAQITDILNLDTTHQNIVKTFEQISEDERD